MEDVLEGATVLSVCKVACSLPYLRSVSRYSPVSFSCCCLLFFTDVLLAVFLCVLLNLDRWQIVAPSTGDTISLRLLLFISHTYGAVFLLTLPAVIMDTFIQLLQSLDTNDQQTPSVNDGKETEKKPFLGYHAIAYLCCLSLWTFGTLNVRWRWKEEEVCVAACLNYTDSLFTCLPTIYSPTMRFLHPCWIMVSLFIALAIILSIFLLSRKATVMHLASPGADTVLFQSSCKIQVFPNSDVELSPGCAKTEKNIVEEDSNRREKVIPLTLTEERQSVGPQSGNDQVFPCPGADVMIGVVCVLAMFVLPLNLSVNIHLIGSVEKTLQWSVKHLGLLKSVMPYKDMDFI